MSDKTNPCAGFNPTELRMYLLARRDLEMPSGKLAAMAGHAFLDCGMRFIKQSEENRRLFDLYQKYGQTKIVLGVDDLNQLLRFRDIAVAAGFCTATVMDEGRTVFPEKTIPVFAIGPVFKQDLPHKFDRLRLY